MGIHSTIGILGGIDPRSTIEYYRQILGTYMYETESGDYPHIIINSINMNQMIHMISNKEFDKLIELLSKEINALASAGADIAIMASSIPHIVFNTLESRCDIPLINLVEETMKEIQGDMLQNIGILGTRFTMQGGFFQKKAEKYGIEIFSPSEDYTKAIHDVYMSELVKGIFLKKTSDLFRKIINEMKENDQIEGLILTGTDFSNMIKQKDLPDIVIYDTTKIHVRACVKQILK